MISTSSSAISSATTSEPSELTFLKEAFQQLWDYSSPAWAGFRAQKVISSGVVGRPQQQSQSQHEKSYGLRTCRVLELSLYHLLVKLPEPETAPDSF
jgi:hypothetical protein